MTAPPGPTETGRDRDRRRRLRLRLEARGRPGLFELLTTATGARLSDRFILGELLAAGGQCHVFAAFDVIDNRELVAKLPAFDYRRPLAYGRAEAEQMRRPLRTEWEVLRSAPAGWLPEPVALLTVPTPVPSAAESTVLGTELVLLQEFVRGRPLIEAALEDWPAWPAVARESAVRRVAAGFLPFWQALHHGGWHYGDVSGNNLLLAAGDGFRVVDAGSAVPAAEEVVLSSWTPAYTTPRLLEAVSAGRPIPGTLASVLPPLAKVLHFALTREEPMNGTRPRLGDVLAEYSPACRSALAAMLDLDDRPEDLPAALATVAEWLG